MKTPLKKKITHQKNFFLLSFTVQLPGKNNSLRATCGRGERRPEGNAFPAPPGLSIAMKCKVFL
jgi:hypothetical protein